jgi:hypothetical protein
MADHYLRWVEGHVDWARFLIEFGHAPFVGALGDELRTLNGAFIARVEEMFSPPVSRGELRRLPRDLTFALTVGPAREFARRWLRDRTESSIAAARRVLPDAACRSMLCPNEPED